MEFRFTQGWVHAFYQRAARKFRRLWDGERRFAAIGENAVGQERYSFSNLQCCWPMEHQMDHGPTATEIGDQGLLQTKHPNHAALWDLRKFARAASIENVLHSDRIDAPTRLHCDVLLAID